MGAGASCDTDSRAIYEQMMDKWDALSELPEYANNLPRPENYEDLVMMGCPTPPPAREFFYAMRGHFNDLKKKSSGVIDVPLNEGQSQGSLQEAFKNRPSTAKKRPNRKRQEMKAKELRENARITSIA